MKEFHHNELQKLHIFIPRKDQLNFITALLHYTTALLPTPYRNHYCIIPYHTTTTIPFNNNSPHGLYQQYLNPVLKSSCPQELLYWLATVWNLCSDLASWPLAVHISVHVRYIILYHFMVFIRIICVEPTIHRNQNAPLLIFDINHYAEMVMTRHINFMFYYMNWQLVTLLVTSYISVLGFYTFIYLILHKQNLNIY